MAHLTRTDAPKGDEARFWTQIECAADIRLGTPHFHRCCEACTTRNEAS